MASTKVPSIEELRARYADVMDDKAVTNISNWREPNSDDPCDEEAYRARAFANAEVINAKILEALTFD